MAVYALGGNGWRPPPTPVRSAMTVAGIAHPSAVAHGGSPPSRRAVPASARLGPCPPPRRACAPVSPGMSRRHRGPAHDHADLAAHELRISHDHGKFRSLLPALVQRKAKSRAITPRPEPGRRSPRAPAPACQRTVLTVTTRHSVNDVGWAPCSPLSPPPGDGDTDEAQRAPAKGLPGRATRAWLAAHPWITVTRGRSRDENSKRGSCAFVVLPGHIPPLTDSAPRTVSPRRMSAAPAPAKMGTRTARPSWAKKPGEVSCS